MTTSFWTNNPKVLFNKYQFTQIWPMKNMTLEEKLNAISRLIILVTIIGFLFLRNYSLLIVGIITLAIIFSIYKYKNVKEFKEGLKVYTESKTNGSNGSNENGTTLDDILKNDFYPTTKKNPFGNVLLTDINNNPNRKAAPPSFNPDVYEDITNAVKKQTQMLNPTILNTNKKLYGDLKDNYDLDNSMIPFYSMPNTRVTNDQGAFSEYLYGSMYSAKEDSPEGALMRVKDNWRWINP